MAPVLAPRQVFKRSGSILGLAFPRCMRPIRLLQDLVADSMRVFALWLD